MTRSILNPDTVRHLESLPAVARVTPRRITYSEAFQRAFVHRYRDGDRPCDIFRDAGIEPMDIGWKRVERCTARWRLHPDLWIPDDDRVFDVETLPGPRPGQRNAKHRMLETLDARLDGLAEQNPSLDYTRALLDVRGIIRAMTQP